MSIGSKPVLQTLRDCRQEGIMIELQKGRHVLGPDVKLSNCSIHFALGAEAIVTHAEFKGCTLSATRLRRLHCRNASFAGCSFSGTYDGIKFGMGDSIVQKCDFSAARLVDCDFQNCDLTEQRFSGWPQVVLRAPRKHARAILDAPWPRSSDKLSLLVQMITQQPENIVGITVSALDWSKRFRVPIEELRTPFDSLTNVVVNDLGAECPWAVEAEPTRPLVPARKKRRAR
jgi:hypothetical protein